MCQHSISAWPQNYSKLKRHWRIFCDFLGHCLETNPEDKLANFSWFCQFHQRVSSTDNSSTVTAVTTIFFTYLVLLERAIWHIWQLIWCSQGSALRCFWSLRDFFCWTVREASQKKFKMLTYSNRGGRGRPKSLYLNKSIFWRINKKSKIVRRLHYFFVWRGCVVVCVESLHD